MKFAKRALLLLPCLAAILALPSCKKTYESYTAPGLGHFSLQYPAGYNLNIARSDDAGSRIEITDGNSDPAQGTWITIDAFKADAKTRDAATALAAEMNDASFAANGLEFVDQLHAIVAGMAAGGVVMRYTISTNIVVSRLVYFDMGNGTICSIHVGSSDQNKDEAKAIFDHLVKTFRIR